MIIATSKPLATYIKERELPRTADARVFELLLPYRQEESIQATEFRGRWSYTNEQEAIDRSCGTKGRRARRAMEMQVFIRQVLRELRERGERLYSVEGEPIPVRGKDASRASKSIEVSTRRS